MKYSYKPTDTVIKLSSRFRGVSWDKRHCAWRASISENGRKKVLGYFESEVEAARVYNEATNKLGRDFLNILPEVASKTFIRV